MIARMARTFFKVLILCALAAPAAASDGKKTKGGEAVADCGTSFAGGSYSCACAAGAGAGSVWGSGPYTADSDICTAALHAGAIGDAGGVVTLSEEPGLDSYSGSSANGVVTRDWGSYGRSFTVASSDGQVYSSEPALPACQTMPEGVDDYACTCPANPPRGSIWGNGPYTADSDICTAAIHYGYIDDEGGTLYVLRTPGLDYYFGAESYEITSSEWGAYSSSITFDWNR